MDGDKRNPAPSGNWKGVRSPEPQGLEEKSEKAEKGQITRATSAMLMNLKLMQKKVRSYSMIL